MITNSDVDPKAPFLEERSFLRVYLEACEGLDGLQAQSSVDPKSSTPLKPRNRGASYETG